MSVLNKIAYAFGRRDELPNQELAAEIVANNDKVAVKELVQNLTNKNQNIQSDCLKALYEVGERNPKLIASYVNDFVALLNHKNNRMVWGAMYAINYISPEKPDEIYRLLPKLIGVAEKGSVITKDNLSYIFAKLGALPKYRDDVFPLMIEQLSVAAVNQLPKYAENALPLITSKNRDRFVKTLSERLPDVESETKRARLEKVIKKAEKIKD